MSVASRLWQIDADVELVQLPAVRRRDQRHQPVAGQAHFLPAVEVVVVGRELDPRPIAFGQAAAFGRVEQVVGRDQVLVDGVAQVRQIRAAERAVPVAAVALAAVELGAGLVDERLVARAASPTPLPFGAVRAVAGVSFLQAAADHLHAGVHLVGFGILHLEVPPVAAADERRDFVPAAFVLPARA